MKTVGEILTLARKEKNLSLEQLSSQTKIDSKYIQALEKDEYKKLPSETFVKGFIRNLSLRLDKNPDELIAIFRRDFKEPNHTADRPLRHKKSLTMPIFLSPQALPFFLGTVVFIVYLIFQFRVILTPPKLAIITPAQNAVLVSPVQVEGDTDVDATISINSENKVKPDTTGHFTARVSLPLGENTIEIKSTNRFSRTTTKKIPITIISQ